MQTTFYRASIDYYKSTDRNKQDKVYKFFSAIDVNRDIALGMVEENLPSMFLKLCTMFPDKELKIVKVGLCYYITVADQIQGFVAVGAVYNVYKVHTGKYLYKEFTVTKYGNNMFIVRDFNGKSLRTFTFTNENEEEVLNSTFDAIDTYADDTEYLKDNNYKEYMRRKYGI